jgi:arsenate reductase (glutaredoxin)
MIYLFGIPNCDTVKKARVFLEKKSIPFEFVDFKKSPPTKELLSLWEKAFGSLPVNSKGQTYKKYSSVYEKLKKADQVQFIIENPSMVKRPILQKDQQVLVFGFDESEFKSALGI